MISILIPTMGRPERLRDCVKSVFDTAANPADVEVLVRVDMSDPKRMDYIKASNQMFGACRMFYPGGVQSYGKGIEYLQTKARGEILFAGADDVLFRTDGWDGQVRDTFRACADGLLVAYANNGMSREKCEHFFTTRKWIDLLGYMVRVEFRHFCVDQWVEELATKIDRLVFLRDVVIEHMHKKYNKAPDDPVYQMVRGDTRTSELDNELYAKLFDARKEGLARLKAELVRAHCERAGVDN